MRALLSASLVVFAAVEAVAQGPGVGLVPPASPLPTRLEPARTVTYSDGYVSVGNLLVPDAPPPASGWPLVVHVHQLGSNRVEDFPWQQTLASHGYAVWSYAVRGQGGAIALNPPDPQYPAGRGTAVYSGHEKMDLAEQVEFTRNAHPALVHSSLLAVTGSSQGGVHAWFAAALSGRTIDAPGRPSRTFPVVAAAAPFDFVPDPMSHRLRDGVLWSDWLTVLVADDTTTGFNLDSVFRSQVRQSFLAQDPGPMLSAWSGEPGRLLAPLLSSIDVPLFYSHAYHDLVCSPQPALAVLRSLPPTTPWKVQFSTIGHNTPFNARERALRDQWTLRWFERYVYGVPNGVGDEDPVARALMPLDPAVRADPSTLWGQAFDSTLDPAVGFQTVRFYLHNDGSLHEHEPAPGTEGRHAIHHTVVPGFGPADWLAHASQRTPQAVVQSIPLNEHAYYTAPLQEDLELGVDVVVDLAAIPRTDRFSVSALLLVRTPGAAHDVMLGHWGTGARGVVPDAPQRVRMQLGPVGSVVPAGSRLVLLLRNLWIREAPMDRRFAAVPMFESYRLDIDHGQGTAASWLEVDVRSTPSVVLDAAPIAIAHDQPGSVGFELRAGRARGQGSYLVVLGGAEYLSAMGVAMDRLNAWIPTSPFASNLSFSALGIYGEEPILRVGALDPAGEAAVQVDLSEYAPLPTALIGQDILVQAWVCSDPLAPVQPGRAVAPSNPVRVRIQ